MQDDSKKSWQEPLSKCLFDMAKIVFTALVVGSCVLISFKGPINWEIIFKVAIGGIMTFSLVCAACKIINKE
ncbi:hypothetical protein Barb6XT_01114 [Bacteroidales bacterium Barb6XT]|nr:hypothetical protein Barb6XT_01114 [Bacteroidales bacterium Barb6XT]